MLIGDTIKLCFTETDIRVSRIDTDEEGEVTIFFTLTDKLDGTVVTGQRTFPRHTQFRDLADFKGELWAGPVVEPPTTSHWDSTKLTLSELIASIVVATGFSYWAEWAPTSLGFILTVGTTALLLGTRRALAMSGLCALAYNFFGQRPLFVFTAPTPKELILLAFYILLSLYVPWLRRRFI